MVRYPNNTQKRVIYAMVVAGEHEYNIAAQASISERSAYRYKERFLVTGEMFSKGYCTPQNGSKLFLWVMDVGDAISWC